MIACQRAIWFMTEHGVYCIPVDWGKKGPTTPDWSKLRIRDFARYFNGARQNIAVLTGLDGLTDFDYDSEEAVWARREYWRPTGMRWGHQSNPDSHHLYFATGGPVTTYKYLDPAADQEGDACLLEVRALDKQGNPLPTIAPDSQHPSGELYEFVGTPDAPGRHEASELMETGRLIAAAALVGRHLGRDACHGVRHQAFLALAGALAREHARDHERWEMEEAQRFLRAVYWVIWKEDALSGDYRRAADLEVETTYNHFFDGKDTTGLRSLVDLLDPKVFRRFPQWLGLKAHEDGQHQQEAPTKPERVFASGVRLETLRTAMITPTVEIIERHIVNDAATLLVGPSKNGKTLFGVQACLSLAAGMALLGNYKVSKTPALIIEADDRRGKASLKDFLIKCRAAGHDPDVTVIYHDPDHREAVIPTIGEPEFAPWLKEQIRRSGAGVCLLDSYTALRGFREGRDIVKLEAEDMILLSDIARELHCAIILVHHDSKTSAHLDRYSRAAGSFAIAQATESQIVITRFPDLPDSDPARLVTVRGRHLDGHQMVIAFRKASLDYDLVLESCAEDYPRIRELWQAFPRTAFDIHDVGRELGWKGATPYRLLGRLVGGGVLRKESVQWTWDRSFTAFDDKPDPVPEDARNRGDMDGTSD